MKKINFYKIGMLLGLVPITGLALILFIYWLGLTFFARDIDVDGLGFLYIICCIPIVLIGFLLTFASIFTGSSVTVGKSVAGLALILFNIPVLFFILRMYGEISRRAYLKVINNSEYELENLTVKEPDNKSDWGTLEQGDSKVIYFYPDYASTEDDRYPGISQNYLMITFNGSLEERQIPIVHPGEVHEIILDKKLNLESVHLNKIILNN
jgi:hypothetical protein